MHINYSCSEFRLDQYFLTLKQSSFGLLKKLSLFDKLHYINHQVRSNDILENRFGSKAKDFYSHKEYEKNRYLRSIYKISMYCSIILSSIYKVEVNE